MRGALGNRHAREILGRISDPLVGYLAFNANLLLWHVPGLYELALRNEWIHALQHALFFYTALLFWWRVIDPTHGWYPMWRWPPATWVYLLVAAPPSYALGTILWVVGDCCIHTTPKSLGVGLNLHLRTSSWVGCSCGFKAGCS